MNFEIARSNNHLIIEDFSAACREGNEQIEHFPDQGIYWESYIEALAAQLPTQGNEKKMLEAWKKYVASFPDSLYSALPEEKKSELKKQKERLLECMAWGIIRKGASSSSPLIRLYAMLGAFFGEDARGVKLLSQGLRDPDASVRSVTLQLVSHLRDTSLQQQVLLLLESEKTPFVRIEVIKALGQMQVPLAEKTLFKLLAEKGVRQEEKKAAVEALADLLESKDSLDFSFLIQCFQGFSSFPSCAAIRELIPSIYLRAEEEVDWEVLVPLLHDPCSDVRQSALMAIGQKRLKRSGEVDWVEEIRKLTLDPHPFVAITAAWALTLHEPFSAQVVFSKWLDHSNRMHRRLAAAALAVTGKYGGAYIKEAFDQADDPYVRMNLAMGLIAQGLWIDQACATLYQGLTQSRERWTWQEQGGFRVLAPNTLHFSSSIPGEFEGTDRKTRLEVLNLLAVMENPRALPAIRDFLQKTEWGLGGIASLLLLQEGDESAAALVESLLSDPQPKVRIQAALVLALWGTGEAPISVLQEAYQRADREMKEKILEAIGRAGDKKSIPFLIDCLEEAQPTLRLIGAAALLQCLYH